jgi:LacI family transcriptional regulator
MGHEPTKKRAGIREIAEAVGISIGTVDRALHGRGGVHPKTREKILKAASRLNYTPNLAARNLKLNRHVRLGVYLPEQIASFFDPLRSGILAASEAYSSARVEVALHAYPRLSEGDAALMEKTDWRQFDGIILAPGNSVEFSAIAREAAQREKPLVYVATDPVRAPRLSSIAVESAISGGIAAELLGQILPGRRKVAVITGSLRIQDHAEKLRGFAASLATLSPHLSLLPAVESHESPRDAHKAALSLIRKHPDLGGIYINTANSPPVMQALQESDKLGNIRVIATDFFPEMAYMIEAGHVFASIHQRPYTQGKAAFEVLSQYLVAGLVPKRVIRLAPHIVLRSNLALFVENLTSEPQSS